MPRTRPTWTEQDYKEDCCDHCDRSMNQVGRVPPKRLGGNPENYLEGIRKTHSTNHTTYGNICTECVGVYQKWDKEGWE